jgi:hypothetical protein
VYIFFQPTPGLNISVAQRFCEVVKGNATVPAPLLHIYSYFGARHGFCGDGICSPDEDCYEDCYYMLPGHDHWSRCYLERHNPRQLSCYRSPSSDEWSEYHRQLQSRQSATMVDHSGVMPVLVATCVLTCLRSSKGNDNVCRTCLRYMAGKLRSHLDLCIAGMRWTRRVQCRCRWMHMCERL